MSIQDEQSGGWWGLSAAKPWLCPECKVATPAIQWAECDPYCEDCGSHDGRECPNCRTQFDHVWGVERLKEAQQP